MPPMCDLDYYSICAKIQKESVLRREKKRNWKHSEDAVQLERDQDYRSRGMPGPHPHADRDTAKDSVSRFMGILKGKSRLMLTRSFRN